MPDILTITDRCASEVRLALDAEPAAGPDAGLRLDIVAGGCSGYQYRLALDRERDGDVVIEARGVRVLVDGEHLPLVRGACVDYRSEAGGAGFRVDNPNVDYSCGCGSSFVLREGAGAGPAAPT